MKKLVLSTYLVLFSIVNLLAQVNARVEVDTSFSDPNYREDQFYASVTYNLLESKPEGISQSGFSSGFHLGFIKDMPINKRRNVAIGIGVGLSTNSYNNTMRIEELDSGGYLYTDLDATDTDFTKNKLSTYILEVPLEFRWRTSKEKIYDFWRVYTGIKFGYAFYNSAKFESSTNDFVSNIADFNNFQYGLTLSVGYDTINLFAYYGLNDLFNADAKFNDGEIEMRAVKIGLIFYIL